jgi:hypothetical protein
MATQECDQSGFQDFIKVITVWECEYPRRFPFAITLENLCDKLPRPQSRNPQTVEKSVNRRSFSRAFLSPMEVTIFYIWFFSFLGLTFHSWSPFLFDFWHKKSRPLPFD